MKESELIQLENLSRKINIANAILRDIEIREQIVSIKSSYYDRTLNFDCEEDMLQIKSFIEAYIDRCFDKLKQMGVNIE